MMDEWLELKVWIKAEIEDHFDNASGPFGWLALRSALKKMVELENKEYCRSLEAAGY